MKRYASVLAAFWFALCMGIPAFAAPDRVPFTIRDDFETGELDAWECYPYAQDIGYDPGTFCQRKPAHNNSRFAAARIVKPNDMGDLSQGFTRQMDLWTTTATRMKLAVFLMADRQPEWLDISLCLFDGGRYFHRVRTPEVDRWLELDIPLREFTANGKPIAAGARVQAVTVKAFYPLVTHLMSYTISMDDFSLNGARQRRFVSVEPKSTDFEKFGYSILNRHFYYGDTIALAVRPEAAPKKGALTAVTAELTDGLGRMVVSGVSLKLKNGAWATDRLYTVKQTDARGQWTVSLAGKDVAGGEVRWGFRFLMPGERLTSQHHPRLHFTAEELKKRLATQSPAEQKMLEGALSNPAEYDNLDLSGINEDRNIPTESLTGNPYSTVDVAFERWRAPLSELSGIVESGAWLYVVKGDEAAGRKAKEALLKLCAFTVWNHSWMEAHGNHTYFPMCVAVNASGTGYDFLYPLLSGQDKKFVRDAIMEKGIKQFHRDMVEMNRMPSSLSNHIAVIVSELSVAATAIYGEDPGNPCLEPYMSGILAKMKDYMDRTFHPDGSYGESVTYQDMASRDLVLAFDTLERNFGIDYASQTHFKDDYLYPLYVTYTNGDYPDFGDIDHNYWLEGTTFQYYSQHFKNPYTYNFVRQTLESGKGDLIGWLFYTRDITPKSREELVPSHFFPDKGNMVMRSGWSDEGSVMVFRCGPNSNHYHYDQGTFQLMTNDEELLSDAGHGSDYYANLYYPCYYIQPIGHNVLLLDGNAESQEPADYENGVAALRDYPHILHAFAGRLADETEGDLTCVYKGKLERYTRSFLYLKPDMVFLLDRVKSPQTHTFSWLFHAEHTDGKSSIRADKNTVNIVRDKARLRMDILSPAIASHRIRNSDRDESFITIAGAPGQNGADFLAVLTPRAIKSPSDTLIVSTSTLLGANGWTGAKVERPDGVTVACFRTGSAPGAGAVEGFAADADRFAATTDKAGNTSLFFVRGSSLARQGASLFKSDRPVSAAVSFGAGETFLETESDAPSEVTIAIEKAPKTVTLNGAGVASGWKYDAGMKMLTLNVPKEHAEVRIK